MGKRYQAELRGLRPGFTYSQYNRGFVFLSFKPCQQLQSPTPNLHRVENTRVWKTKCQQRTRIQIQMGFFFFWIASCIVTHFQGENISSNSHDLTGTMLQYEQFTCVQETQHYRTYPLLHKFPIIQFSRLNSTFHITERLVQGIMRKPFLKCCQHLQKQ